MKICKNCGKELNDNVIFCGNCGVRFEINDEDDNHNKIDKIEEKTNKIKNNKKNIIRTCIGIFLIICGLGEGFELSNILFMLFGLSLMPFIYAFFEKKLSLKTEKIEIIIPVILFLILCISLPSEDTNNDVNKKDLSSNVEESSQEVEEGSKKSTNNSIEKKWFDYYKNNNIDVIDVDSSTLYSYGKYYANKIILTGVKIQDKGASSIKATINDTIAYSFIFNFEQKDEIKNYKKGDEVIIIGNVSSSESSKTVILNKCHIVLSGNEAENKINELSNNKDKYVEYIKKIKEINDQKGDIGTSYIEILDARVVNSYDSKVLIVSFLFENKDKKNKIFDYSVSVKAFQSGIELKDSFIDCEYYDKNYKSNTNVEIQPGIRTNVNKCFLIDDVSKEVQVQVQLSSFASLYNKLNKSFRLG